MHRIDRETPEPSHADQDFVLARRNVVREDNWEEYAAKGFTVHPTIGNPESLAKELALAQSLYGVENVYTGAAWDLDAMRPLQNKPGTTIYISPAGLALYQARKGD